MCIRDRWIRVSPRRSGRQRQYGNRRVHPGHPGHGRPWWRRQDLGRRPRRVRLRDSDIATRRRRHLRRNPSLTRLDFGSTVGTPVRSRHPVCDSGVVRTGGFELSDPSEIPPMIAVNGDTELVWESHGRGPDLVLIHGLGYARWGWKPLVPLLSEHFRVTAFDNRGIGDSSVPPGPYTAAEMASDAEAVLDAADVTKAHIVGTSLGGMIAQELALTVPERVDHLALMSTTPGAPLGHPMPAVTVDLLKKAPSIEPTMA